MHTFKNNFASTFVSDKGSSWTDSYFRLLQIWLFPAWSTDDTFKDRLYSVVLFVASSLVSLLKLLFSKYVLKNLATFLVSKKLAENVNNVLKRVFFLNICSNFLKLALLLYAFKTNIKLLRCFWKLSFAFVHVIPIYTIKISDFLGTSPETLLDPSWF